MINGEPTRVNPISFGDDALLCVVVLGDDRLFFIMEAHTSPIIRDGEEDDSILITTWHQRPGVLFGTDVGDMHFLTLEARIELLRQLVQLS